MGHPDRQRHSIIDPVLKSHKATRFAAIGIEIRKTNEFAHDGKGVEDIEQSLDRLDRDFAAPTGEANQAIGGASKAQALYTFGMKIPERREQCKAGDLRLTT